MARIALATREVWPFVEGGGIGRYIWMTAEHLKAEHEVTIVTSSAFREQVEAGDPRLPEGVAFAFADEPEGDVRPYASWSHRWSASLFEACAALRPDLLEVCDYQGEGFAAVHARRGGDPRLRDTVVACRPHTSAEMTATLNGLAPHPSHGIVWALERFTVRHADVFLWPGGDVLDRYRALYGTTAEPVRLTQPVDLDGVAPGPSPPADGPLRLLYLNRIEPRKGIAELIEAVLAEPDVDLELTITGGDTPMGAGGRSLKAQLARRARPDARISFQDRVPYEQVRALMGAHHAVVVPARYETFSNVSREALAANRPVLATPIGALIDVVLEGESGWVREDLREALRTIDAAGARALIDAGGPRAVVERAVAAEDLPAVYGELAARRSPTRPRARRTLGAVIAHRAAGGGVERTLASLRGQRGVRIAVALAELGAGGHLGAWADGLREVTADRVLLVTAGTELDPFFASRAAAALVEPFAYVTALGHPASRRPWHAPLGGEDLATAGVDAGASVALVRREAACDRLAREPAMERELWTGLSGVVIQEPLVTRLPHRPADDRPPPAGGIPDPVAARRAFG
ncbi:MAG: glycogen synthase [Solirubrobacteraceae bacterium]|nr:glycogen synthase [Solirubrobacteraceae bacterium]